MFYVSNNELSTLVKKFVVFKIEQTDFFYRGENLNVYLSLCANRYSKIEKLNFK